MRNFKYLFMAVLMLFSAMLASGCGGTEREVYEPKKYDIAIDYVGGGLQPSQNVEKVSVFANLQAYKASGSINNTVWVEQSVADYDPEYIMELTKTKNKVIVISNGMGKVDMIKELTGKQLRPETQEGYSFVGLLFADVTEADEKDPVGIFTKESAHSQTDFLAFCSEYEYRERYQDECMVTEYQNTDNQQTEKYKDYLNVFNISEQVYSVSYITMVDFTSNPDWIRDEPKFSYTMWSYADVVPVKSMASGFDNVISVSNAYTIGYCFEFDVEMTKGAEVGCNFFYGRMFKAVENPLHDGYVKALYKEYNEPYTGWRIRYTNEDDTEHYTYKHVYLTAAADFLSDNGHYVLEDCVTIYAVNELGEQTEYTYTVGVDEWAIAWGDNYEDYEDSIK